MATSTKVRGITIELGADTSKLVTDLKSANSAISKTQKELKDVDKLLKFNPGNITLIKQRTQALQTQIGNTKNKLEELKKAEQTMKSKGVDENSEQFRALQREIIATESKLQELNNTAGSGSATLMAISEKTGAIGDKATSAGKKLMPLTAGIAAIGTAAVKTTADFDTAMSQVAAISGATGDDFDALRDKAREMGAKTKFSASEAAEAMNYMAMAGWKTEDMMSGIDGIMNLAAASGEDLATTSDIVTDALTAFGMAAEDSGRFADILAAASSNANTNVAMLGESFKYVAPVAGALGYSAEDVSLALGLMANSGIKASSAGTALRTLFTNMSKPTDQMAAAMENLGVRLDDGQGNMKSFREIMMDLRKGFGQLKVPQEEAVQALQNLDQELEEGKITQKQYDKMVQDWTKHAYGAEGALKAEAAAALAGKQGLSGLLAIVNASDEDFEKLAGAIDGSAGSAKKMADKMQDNLGGQLQILKSQLQELAISFGDLLMPVIRKVVEKIQLFIDKLNGMSAGTKRTIAVIAGIAAAVGPALIVFGKLATAISAITKVMSTMKFTAFLTNPITLAIGAVAGLVAGLKVLNDKLYENTNSLKSYKKDVDEITKANDDLNASIKASKDELEQKITASEAEANAAEMMMNKLNELMAVEDKSAQQKGEIKAIVDKLNELVPELGLAYEEEADKLNKTNAEIERNITLRKQQAQADAYMSVYEDTLKSAAEAELNAARAQDTLNKMYADSAPELQELFDYVNQYGEEQAKTSNKITSSGKSISAAYLENEAALDALLKVQEEMTEAQNTHASELERSETALEKFNAVNAELAETQAEVTKSINKTNLKAFREELGRTFGKDLPAALNKALNKASSYGVELPEELKQGILDGSTDVESAVEQINKLVNAELAKAPQEATKTGAKIPENQATAMKGKKGLVKEAALDLSNSASLKKAETDATLSGAAVPTNFGREIGLKSPLAIGKATSLATSTSNELKKTDATTPGGKVSSDFGSSMWAKRALAIDPAGKIASGTGSALGKTGAKAQGATQSENYGEGILSKVKKAYDAAYTMAGNASQGAKDNNYGNTRGQEFVQGYINGLTTSSLLSGVYWAAHAIGKQAGVGTKDGQKSGSPSKVAIGLGEDFGDGYVIGIQDRIKAAMNASRELVQGAISGTSGMSTLTANRLSAITPNGQTMPAQSVVNYTQNNYSPKALSTSDIYRQSKNLLNLKVDA